MASSSSVTPPSVWDGTQPAMMSFVDVKKDVAFAADPRFRTLVEGGYIIEKGMLIVLSLEHAQFLAANLLLTLANPLSTAGHTHSWTRLPLLHSLPRRSRRRPQE